MKGESKYRQLPEVPEPKATWGFAWYTVLKNITITLILQLQIQSTNNTDMLLQFLSNNSNKRKILNAFLYAISITPTLLVNETMWSLLSMVA